MSFERGATPMDGVAAGVEKAPWVGWLLPLLFAGCAINTVVGNGNAGSDGGGSGSTTAAVATSGWNPATSGGDPGTGTTSGGTTGAQGGCVPLSDACGGNTACCSGACNQVCGQPFAQGCFDPSDCTSGVCVDDVCACNFDGGCAVDQDCCDNDTLICSQAISPLSGIESGRCCRALGKACEVSSDGTSDCCTRNCINNLCDCLPVAAPGCDQDADCCGGKCLPSSGYQGGFLACANGPGEACSLQDQCSSQSCVDGGCGTCAAPSGVCSTDADCCGGLVCASFTTSGLDCCVPNGLPSDAGADCCSYLSSGGVCTCLGNSERCFSDHGCCAGSACMPLVDAGAPAPVGWVGPGIPSGIQSACCRADGENCFTDVDCCSGTCQNQQCGCVATGGQCGLPGQVAPEGAQACCSHQCSAAGACL